jgi:hypothetical protein
MKLQLNPFLFLLLIFGCQSPKNENENLSESKQTQSIAGDRLPDKATLAMIEKVNAANNKIDPSKISSSLNTVRGQMIGQQMQSQTGVQRINLEFRYAREMVRAGETEIAINSFLSIIDQLRNIRHANKEQILFMVKKDLAISYMRKAEQENCLLNHTAESCIIPISENGQHLLQEGSQKTIELLNELLVISPNDKDCHYLLNIAHMTLGQYPEKVPAQFRIPPSYFNSSEDIGMFKDVAMNLGVDHTALSGGTCIDDFNGDGYLDIIASSWGATDQIQYFENDTNGGFENKTKSTGLRGITGGLNLRHADYNNDGHIDFLILRGAWLSNQGKIPNSLIRNNGDGTFTDVTIEAGIYSESPTQTAVWSDFNLDGWLDLFIANETNEKHSAPCELLVSNRDGTFSNVTQAANINITGFFKGVACGDLNQDGYPDLYLSNQGAANQLFINNSASGTLNFTLTSAGVEKPLASFPTWIFDYNNDGLEDIFVSGYGYGKLTSAGLMLAGINKKGHPQRPYLYKNNGNGSFTDVSLQLGLNEPITTMGCNYGDLNNDGFLDFYLATGEPNLFSIVPNRMYLNDGGKQFKDVTYKSGFGHIQKGHAVGFGDLDNDGDQDIYAVMGGAYDGDVFQNILFENPIGNQNNWINILLEGVTSNKSAIGARMTLTINNNGKNQKIYHTISTGASFGGNSLLAEIGLDKATILEKLEIIWPNKSQTKSVFENVPVNSFIKIKEGDSNFEKIEIKATPFSKEKEKHHHHH